MIYTSKQDCLRIFRHQSPVTVLGPFKRAIIWVQGCEFACPGCIVPESWDKAGGDAITLTELASWILAQSDIEGKTLSGGEPMMQAAALVSLIDAVRQLKNLGVMCYTGYRFEQLQQQGTAEQKLLCDRIDLLVDGTYIESLHKDLLWRGSSNQRLWLLTDRYREEMGFNITFHQAEHPDHPASAVILGAATNTGKGISVSVPIAGQVFYDVDGYMKQSVTTVDENTVAVCDKAEQVLTEMHEALEDKFGVKMGEVLWEGKAPKRILRQANQLPKGERSRDRSL